MTKTKGPRAASTYRGARRNHWKQHRALNPAARVWDQTHVANNKAHLAARQTQANNAREAAAKALVKENSQHTGLRRELIVSSALLTFYRGERPTRPVSRIIRHLEAQNRKAA